MISSKNGVNKFQEFVFVLLRGGVLFQCWILAHAQPISIANPSFETADLALSGNGPFSQLIAGSTIFTAGGTLAGWQASSTNTNAAAGAFDPSPGGRNWTSKWWTNNNTAYVQMSSTGTVSLSQTLSTALKNNTTYTLSALVGRRIYTPRFNYALQLWAGSTSLASASNLGLANDSSGTDSVSYSTGSNHPQAGQPLMIVLSSTGISGIFTEAFFDDITLTASGGGATHGQPTFSVSTFAGNGGSGYSGDGGPATGAGINPNGVAVDATGNLYIVDIGNERVRKVSTNGTITTVAGTGAAGFSGDGGPAIKASLNQPSRVAVDTNGNLYIADSLNNRVRKVGPDGTITTVAGNGGAGNGGDGGPATSAALDFIGDIVLDPVGNLFIATNGNVIRKVTSNGIITTVAGNGSQGYSGDGGPATNAAMNTPRGVAIDGIGNLYIADQGNQRIRRVSNGIITTVAGVGAAGYSGDGGIGTSAKLNGPSGISRDAAGNLYISDRDNNRVRVLLTDGTIWTVAGNGKGAYSGDGGPASNAALNGPRSVATLAGSVYVADTLNERIRLLVPAGYTCTNSTPPVITFIDSASGYGGYPYFTSGSWLEIKGTNLADPADPRLAATNPGQWTSSDFSGVNAPTMLDGIGVSINGKPAYVWYLSPTQLNVQAPEDSAIGNVAITVTNCNATSSPFMFARQALAPGMLAPANYSANGTQYMIATFASDGAYVLNTSTGAAFGLNSRPAKPGDVIVAYGIGFGDVTPSILPGVIVQQSNSLVNPVTVSFGSTPATLSYSGLAGGYVGLYEFFITVPSGLANGDYQINVAQNGIPVPQTMYLTVHN